MSKLLFISSVKDDKLRKKLLDTFSNESLYQALSEIARNAVKGRFNENKTNKTIVKRYSRLFNKLKHKKHKKSIKRRLIRQSGGFLPFIIPALASLLPAILN